jgi:hypothetical protein
VSRTSFGSYTTALGSLLVFDNNCSWAAKAQQGEAGGRTSAERPHFRLYFLVRCVTLPCKNLVCWGLLSLPARGFTGLRMRMDECCTLLHDIFNLASCNTLY